MALVKNAGALALLGTLVSASGAFAASSPVGVWIDHTGRGAVEIKECGNALCGKVVWIKTAEDGKNCGTEILGEVVSEGDNTWGGGWIYSPERNKRYNVEITPQSNGELKVVGYKGVRFLSKTMIWTKAPSDIQRCDGASNEAAAPAQETTPEIQTGSVDKSAEASPSTSEPAPDPAAPSRADNAPAAKSSETTVAEAPADEGIANDFGVKRDGDNIEVGDIFKRKNGKCNVSFGSFNMNFDCNRSRDRD